VEVARRFGAATPPMLFHDRQKICVGELTLDLTRGGYSIDATSSCTGGRFPAVSGTFTQLEIWKLMGA
jgi:hypothetical protein